jgi:hypothetical protein
LKKRGKLCGIDPLDNPSDPVEWVCTYCKRINTVLIFGCEHCGEKRKFDVEPEVYKQKIRFDDSGRLLPSVLHAGWLLFWPSTRSNLNTHLCLIWVVIHKINAYALDGNVDGVLSQMLDFSGKDPNALATGCTALGHIVVSAGKGTDAEFREFQGKFLPKAIDCFVFASRSCPEDAYVQRSVMNGLWWRLFVRERGRRMGEGGGEVYQLFGHSLNGSFCKSTSPHCE